MAEEVKVPVLGESITEATIGEWLVKPGETVGRDDPIASLETDKVTIEVPAPSDGVMGDHIVNVGDTVEVGAVIAMIEAGDVSVKPAAKAETAPKTAPAESTATTAAPTVVSGDMPTMSPTVRRLVLEHGIDPTTKEDILDAAKAQGNSAPSATPAPSESSPKAAVHSIGNTL